MNHRTGIRAVVFFLAGITACLFSAYINSFFTAVLADNGYTGLSIAQSMVQVTPVCEEFLKALPVFFFTYVFWPKRRDIAAASIATGLGFAALENIFILSRYGSEDIALALVCCLATATTHTVCAIIVGCGLAALYRKGLLALPGSFSLLCASSTFHAFYNLFVAEGGAWIIAGLVLPLATGLVICLFVLRIRGIKEPS